MRIYLVFFILCIIPNRRAYITNTYAEQLQLVRDTYSKITDFIFQMTLNDPTSLEAPFSSNLNMP